MVEVWFIAKISTHCLLKKGAAAIDRSINHFAKEVFEANIFNSQLRDRIRERLERTDPEKERVSLLLSSELLDEISKRICDMTTSSFIRETLLQSINGGVKKMQRKCKECGCLYTPLLGEKGKLPKGYKQCPKCNSRNTIVVGD